MLSAEGNPYYDEKESSSAVHAKDKDVEKVGISSKEGTLIKSTVDMAFKITKNDAKSKRRKTFKWKFPMQLLKKN